MLTDSSNVHLMTFLWLAEIRNWWEVPSIAHFCSLFRAAFGLTDFEIEVTNLFIISSIQFLNFFSLGDEDKISLSRVFLAVLHISL